MGGRERKEESSENTMVRMKGRIAGGYGMVRRGNEVGLAGAVADLCMSVWALHEGT